MLLYLHEELLFVDDLYVKNSPYLTILENSLNNVDYHMDKDLGKIYFIYDDWIKVEDFMNYLKLISLELDGYVSEELLRFMGHTNPLQYPNDFWNVKLHDNLIRENFYSYPWILEDPYFGLEDVSNMISTTRAQYVRNTLHGYDENVYIAGGSAMYMAGIIDDTRDIDIFVTDRKSMGSILRPDDQVLALDNCISYRTETQTDKTTYAYSHGNRTTIQIILREYRTPSEIVHGFDLDCCGYLYHPSSRKLYRTRRAKYSTEHKTNYFDPERSSPSYPIRLAKYYMRGYDIWMPYENLITFDNEEYEKYMDKLLLEMSILGDYREIYGEDFSNIILKPLILTDDDVRRIELLVSNGRGREDTNMFILSWKNSGLGLGEYIKKELSTYESYTIADVLPNDPVSIIYLMKMRNLFISTNTLSSDYETYNNGHISNYMSFKDVKPKWKVIDPMEQSLSGTFYPNPIKMDILEWYGQSPLIRVQ